MDQLIYSFINFLPLYGIFVLIAISIFFLGKGADILVEQSVILSLKWNVPKVIIGATIISLGTTLPEASVSVMSAIEGKPGIALGNGIGSFIANTGFIIGLAAIIGKIPVEKTLVRKQGTVKAVSVILLLAAAFPFSGISESSGISRTWGFIFLFLLLVYLIISLRWAKYSGTNSSGTSENFAVLPEQIPETKNILILLKLLAGIGIVIASSKILIQSVEITAFRIGISESVIAATLVAFGTSIPELIMAVKSVQKGHGELALGNVTGANILNILFVIGASAAVSAEGLAVPESYYYLQFPAMIILGILFFVFCFGKKSFITKTQGVILMAIYIIYTGMNFIMTF